MSTKVQFACDGLNCTEVRKECNHWFAVCQQGNSISLYTWDKAKVAGHDFEEWLHFCGQQCIQKFVEGWMNSLANSEGQPK